MQMPPSCTGADCPPPPPPQQPCESSNLECLPFTPEYFPSAALIEENGGEIQQYSP
jgi:hypothetical protein